jgi:hypothetical protein
VGTAERNHVPEVFSPNICDQLYHRQIVENAISYVNVLVFGLVVRNDLRSQTSL